MYYRKLFSLEGRVAIVTGGAGHLGAAISKGLAAYGAKVILIGRTKEKLEDFINANNIPFDNKFEFYACDVCDQKKFGDIVKEIRERHNGIDILVNNAYIKRKERFHELTKEEWYMALENNLTQYFTSIQKVGPIMLEKGKGVIVNIASIYGFLGIDHRIFLDLGNNPSVHYAVAKGGILQMTKYLAALWAREGIRVNAISPGYFPRKKRGSVERKDYIEEICKRTPMNRYGEPDEIAGAVVFLASDASSFLTGQNIIVDGGWSVW